jgi:hypothetical protein
MSEWLRGLVGDVAEKVGAVERPTYS